MLGGEFVGVLAVVLCFGVEEEGHDDAEGKDGGLDIAIARQIGLLLSHEGFALTYSHQKSCQAVFAAMGPDTMGPI